MTSAWPCSNFCGTKAPRRCSASDEMAWPSPRHAEMAHHAAAADARFAATLSRHNLLLPSLDALAPEPSRAWRPLADDFPVSTPRDLAASGLLWPFEGTLYSNQTAPKTKCEDAARILASWKEQCRVRTRASASTNAPLSVQRSRC